MMAGSLMRHRYLTLMMRWGKYMKQDARQVWSSKKGQHLMESMLNKRPLTPEDKETMSKLLKMAKPR